MKYYQYISMPKIEMLYQQVMAQEAEHEAEVGFDIKILKGSIKTKHSNELGDHQKLDAVTRKLRKLRLVGEVEDEKPYVNGVLPLKFGGYGLGVSQTSPIAFWGGKNFAYPLRNYAFAMAGSRHNLIGEAGNVSDSMHSHSLTDAMTNWFITNLPDLATEKSSAPSTLEPWEEKLSTGAVAQGTWLAASQSSGVAGKYEFVAKILHRGVWKESHQDTAPINLILGTPLYVASVA